MNEKQLEDERVPVPCKTYHDPLLLPHYYQSLRFQLQESHKKSIHLFNFVEGQKKIPKP